MFVWKNRERLTKRGKISKTAPRLVLVFPLSSLLFLISENMEFCNDLWSTSSTATTTTSNQPTESTTEDSFVPDKSLVLSSSVLSDLNRKLITDVISVSEGSGSGTQVLHVINWVISVDLVTCLQWGQPLLRAVLSLHSEIERSKLLSGHTSKFVWPRVQWSFGHYLQCLVSIPSLWASLRWIWAGFTVRFSFLTCLYFVFVCLKTKFDTLFSSKGVLICKAS